MIYFIINLCKKKSNKVKILLMEQKIFYDLTIFEKDRKNYYEKTYTHIYHQTIITDIVRLIPINYVQYCLNINKSKKSIKKF